jgi:drug/metabolite transporter (DMT)-like permease
MLGGPAFLISMNVAVDTSGVAISGFVVGQYTIFAVILARPLLGEAVAPRVLVGLVAALAGTVLIADRPGAGIDPAGVVIGMVGAVAYALFIVLGRRWSGPYRLRPEVIVLFVGVSSTLVAGAWVAIVEPGAILPATVEPQTIVALVWIAFVLAGGQSLLMATLRRTDTRIAATMLLLNPLTAALLAIIVLGETLSGPQVAGAALVLVGMVVAIRSGGRGQGNGGPTEETAGPPFGHIPHRGNSQQMAEIVPMVPANERRGQPPPGAG